MLLSTILASLTISSEAASFLGIGLTALLAVTGYGLIQIHLTSKASNDKIEKKLDDVLRTMNTLERELSSSKTLAETAQREVRRLRRTVNNLFAGYHELDKIIAVRLGLATTGVQIPKLEENDDNDDD